ncbi:hypothetical protein QTP88_027292 [Uroleucon formosanum]
MSDEDNDAILNEQKRLESGESFESINKNFKVKWPVKRKIDKKSYNRRRNARMRRLMLPKSALVVFSELFRGVPIQIEESQLWNVRVYTATIEIDGQTYTANNISKSEAKQNACENLFRSMLLKKLTMESEKKKYLEEKEMENEINGKATKPFEPLQEDFPWLHIASFAIHQLINKWKLQPASKDINVQDKSLFSIQLPPKVAAPMFPVDPTQYHPVSLLAHLRPDRKFESGTSKRRKEEKQNKELKKYEGLMNEFVFNSEILDNLALLSIESDLTSSSNFDDIINEYALKKARKVIL